MTRLRSGNRNVPGRLFRKQSLVTVLLRSCLKPLIVYGARIEKIPCGEFVTLKAVLQFQLSVRREAVGERGVDSPKIVPPPDVSAGAVRDRGKGRCVTKRFTRSTPGARRRGLRSSRVLRSPE